MGKNKKKNKKNSAQSEAPLLLGTSVTYVKDHKKKNKSRGLNENESKIGKENVNLSQESNENNDLSQQSSTTEFSKTELSIASELSKQQLDNDDENKKDSNPSESCEYDSNKKADNLNNTLQSKISTDNDSSSNNLLSGDTEENNYHKVEYPEENLCNKNKSAFQEKGNKSSFNNESNKNREGRNKNKHDESQASLEIVSMKTDDEKLLEHKRKSDHRNKNQSAKYEQKTNFKLQYTDATRNNAKYKHQKNIDHSKDMSTKLQGRCREDKQDDEWKIEKYSENDETFGSRQTNQSWNDEQETITLEEQVVKSLTIKRKTESDQIDSQSTQHDDEQHDDSGLYTDRDKEIYQKKEKNKEHFPKRTNRDWGNKQGVTKTESWREFDSFDRNGASRSLPHRKDNRVSHYRNLERYIEDKNFQEWLQNNPEIKYKHIQETEGDLFEASEEFALAHCVAEDLNMGSGIAVAFRQKFRRVDELLNQREKTGGLAVLNARNRFVYYLITKKNSAGKPTLQSLWKSLQKLKSRMLEDNVSKLAIPRIGCGLDRLEWSDVKPMIEYTFLETNVEIVVYNFQQDENTAPLRNRNCKVVPATYSLLDIEPYTAIVYLCSEDGEVTDEMERLDTKFNFIQSYKNARKKCGEIIEHRKTNYTIYGFVVKKRVKDVIDFIHFQKCTEQLRKQNKDYEYVAIETFEDEEDNIIMDKLINLLRNTLRDVEVYVCTPKSMSSKDPEKKLSDK